MINIIITIISTIISIALFVLTKHYYSLTLEYQKRELEYKEKELKYIEEKDKSDEIIEINEKITIFTSRKSMLKYIHSMYEKAQKNDIIWAQSVTSNSFGDADKEVISSARRGVKFEMIFTEDINSPHNLKKELKEAIEIVKGTVVIKCDNKLRIHGLSDKEVVISFPTKNAYRAILIKDEGLIEALRYWFEFRLKDDSDNTKIFKP